MARVKEQTGFSVKADEEFENTEKALKKVADYNIEKSIKNNGYLVISDKDGNIKKIPAKDL